MEFLIGLIFILLVVGAALYYLGRDGTKVPGKVPYKIETPYLHSDDLGITVVPVVEQKSVQQPAKMAKPKLTKVEGGTSKKPSSKTPKSKTTSDSKNQKPKNRKPKPAKKPTE